MDGSRAYDYNKAVWFASPDQVVCVLGFWRCRRMPMNSAFSRLIAVTFVLLCGCAAAQFQWSAPTAPYGGPMPSLYGSPTTPASSAAPAPTANPLQPWLAPAPTATTAPAGAVPAPGAATGGWYNPWGTTQPANAAPLPTIPPGGGFTGPAMGGWYTPAPETQQPLAPNPWVQQTPSSWSPNITVPAPVSPWLPTAPSVAIPQSGWQQTASPGGAAPTAPGITWNTAPTLPQSNSGPLAPADGLLPNPWVSAAPQATVAPNPWVNTAVPGLAVPQDTTLTPGWPQPATNGWQYVPAAPGAPEVQSTAPNPWMTTPPSQGTATAPTAAPNPWLPSAATTQPPAGAWWQRDTVPTSPGLYGTPAAFDGNATNPTP